METSRRRRSLLRALVAVVAVLLLAGLVDDVQAHRRLQHANSQLSSIRSSLQRTAALLTSTATASQRSDHATEVTRGGLTKVEGELTGAQQLLSQAKSGAASGTIEVGAVHSCADGVQRAASDLQDGHQAQAVAALSAASAVCENVVQKGGGPVYPFDFADPFVLVSKGLYFAYGTNSTNGNIQIMESSDLTHWTKAGDALPTLASWAAPDATWAPAVIHLKRSYVLYYTAALAGSNVQCLSVATAKRPQGPFTDNTKAPLECQTALGGSIDPSPYLDGSGQPYLVWRSIGAGGQPATIWGQALSSSGTTLEGSGPVPLLHPSEPWESTVVEAPTMTFTDGTYFLFFSGNNWDTADYAIGVVRCSGALGPCGPSPAAPLFASQSTLEGPGGATVFTATDGQLEMAFQAWLPGAVGYPHPRLLFIRPLTVVDGLPRVGPPS
jgi:hypothetical protein